MSSRFRRIDNVPAVCGAYCCTLYNCICIYSFLTCTSAHHMYMNMAFYPLDEMALWWVLPLAIVLVTCSTTPREKKYAKQ